MNGRSFPVNCSASEIAAKIVANVSTSTVLRDLKALGFASRVRRKVPTREPKTIEARLQFCKYWARRTKMCERVVFSDEHTVSINDHTTRRMWVGPGECAVPRERRRLQNIPRVMVWAAVGIGFKSPIVLFPQEQTTEDGKRGFRLEKKGYVRRCLSVVVPQLLKERRIFQQDGAKPHQNNHVRDYLKGKKVEVMESWPPYSPDINMIELLWPLLNRRVAELYPHTLDELLEAVKTAWDSITQDEIDAICRGFAGKVAEVCGKGGAC
jgi:transposase